MSKHKITEALRLVLWRAHDYRCVYTGEYLRRDEVVVDHVIPEMYALRPAELALLLERFGRRPDFELDGEENLVPTFGALNARKREKVGRGEMVCLLDEKMRLILTVSERGRTWKWSAEDLVRRGLDAAGPKVMQVRAMTAQIDEELRFGQNASRFKGQGGSVRRALELASGEDTEFSGPGVTDAVGGWMTVVERTVHLSVRLPRFPHLNGTALLTLKTPLVRDCMFTFGPRELAGQLLAGATGTGPEGRPFVIETEADRCWVQFGSASMWLLRDETEDVCRAVDRLRPAYVEAVQQVEREVYRSTDLDWARRGYRLMNVDLATWSALVRFASAHGHAAAERSEWNVFDVWPGSLRFVCPHPNEPEARTRAVVHGEWGEEVVVHAHGGRSVWICWDPRIFASIPETEDRFRAGVTWDAMTTLEWVSKAVSRAKEWAAEEAAPRAAPVRLRDRVSERLRPRMFSPAAPAPRVGRTSPPPLSAAPSAPGPPRFGSLDDLRDWLQDVQQFYNGKNELEVTPGALAGMYEMLLWCLDGFTGVELALPYVLSNLGCPGHGDAARGLREEIAGCEREGGGPAWSVDLTARSLLEVLERGTPKGTPAEVLRQASRKLSPIAEALEASRRIERLARMRW